MSLKYSLFENHLTTEPGDYMAVTTDTVTLDLDAIIERMGNMGSTVTKADILSVMEDFHSAVKEFVKEGANIKTPLFKINQSISGVFNERGESFDNSKHRVNINLIPGADLRAIRGDIRVERVDGVPARPAPIDYKDVNAGVSNDVLTPGGVGELLGNNLKFDTDDSQQGIFLIASDGSETRVQTMVRNKPSNLIFLVPTGLAAGTYTLEVRSILPGIKNVRSGVLDAELSVS